MRTVTESIDAKLARQYLEKNDEFSYGNNGGHKTNRPLSLTHINNLAKDMLAGNWRLTHQGIAFDKRGKLKDGQHRLKAVVQAAEFGALDGEEQIPPNPKIKIQFNVTYGLDNETFDVLDVGRTRTSTQILTMDGHVNTNLLSATTRLLYLIDNYDQKLWRSVKVTPQTLRHAVNDYGIFPYINRCAQLGKVGFITTGAVVGLYIAERAWPEGPHELYLDGLKNGENLNSDSPVLVLRNYMIRQKTQTGFRREAWVHTALYIKAWNDFVAGRKRNYISFRSGSQFPTPYTPEGM